MPEAESTFSYRLLTDPRCAVTRMTGEFEVEAFLKGMETVFADQAAGPEMNCLHDWREVRLPPDLGFQRLSAYARVLGERLAGDRSGVRVAVLVAHEEWFGVVRQAIALLEDGTLSIERRPFLNLEEACAWLGLSPADVEDAR